jgi:hypothetical protein
MVLVLVLVLELELELKLEQNPSTRMLQWPFLWPRLDTRQTCWQPLQQTAPCLAGRSRVWPGPIKGTDCDWFLPRSTLCRQRD